MQKQKELAPILKWVGGKRQLLKDIQSRLPDDISSYCEPFIGGAAVLLALQPCKAVVNDVNPDLILVYKTIRDQVDDVIKILKTYQHSKDEYYRIRALDRDIVTYSRLSDAERAARILYLNRTCFNGLYRVNSNGQFNVPFGDYKNPNIVNEDGLKAVSEYFNNNDITFLNTDFLEVLEQVPDDGFVYLDPPYDPVSDTSNFTAYSKEGFGKADQRRLKYCCDKLHDRGVKFMQSNAATPFILDLYKDYQIDIVQAKRNVNRDAAKRGVVDEVLIYNY